jgi:hypothetical protein
MMDVIEEFLAELDETTLFQLSNVVSRRVRKLAALKRKNLHDRQLIRQLISFQRVLMESHRKALKTMLGDLTEAG